MAMFRPIFLSLISLFLAGCTVPLLTKPGSEELAKAYHHIECAELAEAEHALHMSLAVAVDAKTIRRAERLLQTLEKRKQVVAESHSKQGFGGNATQRQSSKQVQEWFYQAIHLQSGLKGDAADLEGAMVYFRKAADAGHAEAKFRLGVLYADEKAPWYDKVQARQWLQKAEQNGYLLAEEILEVLVDEE